MHAAWETGTASLWPQLPPTGAKNYKREQRVIDTIVELKSQSLRQIARTLSKLKIPTKLSGVAWHPMMVKRVLDYLAKDVMEKRNDEK